MSKFCMQCGKEIEDKDLHCQYCGASQNNDFGNNSNPAVTQKSNGDHIVPIVAICSVILVIIIVIANLTIFNNGYKEPIDSLFDAIESGDIDDLEDAFPEYYLDSDKYDDDKMEDALKIASAGIDLLGSDNIDISYDVIDKEAIDDDELEKLEDKIKKQYDEKVDVDKGYEVKINMLFEFGKLEKSQELTIKVYKIDGKWCITEDSMSSVF